MKRLFALAVLIAGAMAPIAAPAQDFGRPALGAGRGDQDEARQGVRAGRQIPMVRIMEMLRARHPGRPLNASLGDAGGRTAYFVQWMFPDSRVVVFVVDAETGQILGQQGR